MSETRPIYAVCARSNSHHVDCLIARHGDGIRLIGYAEMTFSAVAARQLARDIQQILGDASADSEPASGDPLVDAVRARLAARARAGQAKYGTTMLRTDLDTMDWIRHAQEELLDGAVYLERLYRDFERLIDDGR